MKKIIILLLAFSTNKALAQTNNVSILNDRLTLDISGNQNGIQVKKTGMFGAAGVFEHSSTTAMGAALAATSYSNFLGGAFFSTHYGSGGAAGVFTISNSLSLGLALRATTDGLGPTGLFTITNASNTSSALEANTIGAGPAGYFTSAIGPAIITGTGNVGIGITSPNAPLQFSNSTANRKVVLYETANNDHQYYGIGINSGVFRYQVDGTSSNHIFYAGTSASASNELMRITGLGNVGIGNNNPTASLQVSRGTGVNGTAAFNGTTHISHFNYSTTEHTYIRGGKDGANVYINDVGTLGNVAIGNGTPTEKLHVFGNLRVSGTICNTSGAITACSDVRYKKNFSKIENPLNKVLSLNGLQYDWRVDEFKENNFSKSRQIGFIAQEMEKVFPEMVFTDEKGFKSVDYARLTPVLVEAIKEQQKMIDNLRFTNDDLKKTNGKLESRLDKIDAMLNK
jgi:hypothetical protein